jgi:hypothetical protein
MESTSLFTCRAVKSDFKVTVGKKITTYEEDLDIEQLLNI